MDTSRRTMLAGLVGLAAAQTAVAAAAPPQAIYEATVAEERFAKMIATAHAPDVTCTHLAQRYADTHWHEYVVAARAVLDARM